jgi:hypothetical protein
VKAVKKIDETRKRATEILSQKQRNYEINQMKLARRQQEEADKQAKAQANYQSSKEQNERTKIKKIEAVNNTRG